METTATVDTSIGNTSTEAYTTDNATSDDEIPVAVGTEGEAGSQREAEAADPTATTTVNTANTNTTTTTTTNNITTVMTTLMEITSMNSFDSTALNDSIMDSDITTGNGNAAVTVAGTHGIDRRTSTAVTSVTSERKEQLLLQARYDRIQWIHQTPLPYRTGEDGTTAAVSHATFHLPTVQKVVQYLYAPATATIHVNARFEEELKKTPHSRFQQNLYCMNGQQIIDAELEKFTDQDNHTTTKVFLQHYRSFILALEDPSAATIVQKLRSFLRQLHNSISKHDSDDSDNVETVAPIIAKFQSYTHSIYDTVRHHLLFADLLHSTDNNSTKNHPNQSDHLPTLLQRCYDSFVYGHCYSYFHTLFYTLDVRQKSELFQANVLFLSSFVTPVHLDIHCFTSILSDHGESGNHATLAKEQNVQELLTKSVSILQSIDSYYSPYEKLQCILRLYHEINIALKSASTSTTKLPSADDVLPTFIYVILLSVATTSSSSSPLSEPHQPHNTSNLFYNLYYIEQLLTSSSYISDTSTTSSNHNMSSIHYLRGEAGYAYTNLYSAYQFISDFDITSIVDPFGTKSSPLVLQDKTATVDDAPPPPSSLSISKEAWNAAIEAYKVKAQKRYDEIQKASSATDMLRIDSYEADLSFDVHFVESSIVNSSILSMSAPTPMDIRQARLRGETIDLNWAIQQQQVNNQQQSLAAVASQPQLVAPRTVFEQVEENLPHGFQRNYSFLNALTVDDLKYHDVEQLLQEYHMLVRTTETLLSDRARQISRERRVHQLQKEKALIEQQQQQQASYSMAIDK